MRGVFPLKRSGLAAVALAAAAIAEPAFTHDEPAPHVIEPSSTESPPDDAEPRFVLPRIVRRFDFEERMTLPWNFPAGFARTAGGQTEQVGFSNLGSMGFAEDAAHSGRWSFKFSLESGSMAAALRPGEGVVLAGAQYSVSGWVRTLGLQRARAAVAIWFADQSGRRLEGPPVRSDLIETAGEWRRAEIEHARAPDGAASIIVQFQLLQPDMFHDSTNRFEPVLKDVSGSAWFDDFVIEHEPLLSLSVAAPGNVVHAPQTPRITVDVLDITGDPVLAEVKVHDVHGHGIVTQAFDLAAGRHSREIALPGLSFGWYHVESMLRTREGALLARAESSFVYIPEGDYEAIVHPDFGFDLGGEPIDHLATLLALSRDVGAGALVLPLWDSEHWPGVEQRDLLTLAASIDELQSQGRRITLAATFLPRRLAESLGVGANDVGSLFAERNLGDARIWLEPLLGALGSRVREWEIAEPIDIHSGTTDETAALRLSEMLRTLVSEPMLVLPRTPEAWTGKLPATESSSSPVIANHIEIPYWVAPHMIGEFLQSHAAGANDLITIAPLPDDRFSARDREIDLIMRILSARQAGEFTLLFDRPWRPSDSGEFFPDPLLPTWVQASRALRGKRFAGELRVGEDNRALVFEGDGEGTILAWSDSLHLMHENAGRLARPDAALDLAGNVLPIAPADANEPIQLSSSPVYLQAMELESALFQQAFHIAAAENEPDQPAHSHEVVIANPWNQSITGTIDLIEPEGCSIAPRFIEFAIGAGEETRIPIEVTANRYAPNGSSAVLALVEVTGEQTYAFEIDAELTIETIALSLDAVWSPARNGTGALRDLVIRATIVNETGTPLTLDCAVLAPGCPRQQRSLGVVAPGESASPEFVLEGGLERLAGKSLLISVGETGESARVNRRIAFPQ